MTETDRWIVATGAAVVLSIGGVWLDLRSEMRSEHAEIRTQMREIINTNVDLLRAESDAAHADRSIEHQGLHNEIGNVNLGVQLSVACISEVQRYSTLSPGGVDPRMVTPEVCDLAREFARELTQSGGPVAR